MREFLNELEKVNVLESRLMGNNKYRSLSLFGKDLDKNNEFFDYCYNTIYKGSYAQVAQAHRHRTLNYQIEMLDDKEYYIPPIISDDKLLVNEWLEDMNRVKDVFPQGELVKINESGEYKNFILKCKERLCSDAQIEIMRQTRETLMKYKKHLEKSNNLLADDIKKYTRGARCTFPDFDCLSDCKFNEGKKLVRMI